MTDLLMTLAEISLTMSAVILLLLALGPLLARRYAARWRYWAWLVVAVRLLVPVNLSLPRAPVQLEAPADRIVYTYPPPAAPSAAPVGPEFSAESPAPLPSVPPETSAGAVRSLTLGSVAAWVWLAGAAALTVWYGAGYLCFLRYVRRWSSPAVRPAARETLSALQTELDVRRPVRLLVCPGLSGPMMAGLLRPVILLPHEEEDSEALWFILRHELTHCRRRDIAYKTLLLCAKVVHWCNPLVWLMVRAAEGDLERACDDRVVAGLGPEARARYGQIILAALGSGRASRP